MHYCLKDACSINVSSCRLFLFRLSPPCVSEDSRAREPRAERGPDWAGLAESDSGAHSSRREWGRGVALFAKSLKSEAQLLRRGTGACVWPDLKSRLTP